MDQTQIIKFSYHAFCFVFLIYVSYQHLSFLIRIFLRIIAMIHLFDALWFSIYTTSAPI